MSYSIRHNITEGDIILPLDFAQSDSTEVKEKQNLIDVLEFSIRDLDTVSAKLYKEVQEKISILNTEINKINANGFVNKYGFSIFINEKTALTASYQKTQEGVFFLNEDTLFMITAEGEYATFIPDNGSFILDEEGYTESNYGWVGEVFIKLAKTFKNNVVFEIVTEEGEVDLMYVTFNNAVKNKVVMDRVNSIFSEASMDKQAQVGILETMLKEIS